MENVCSLQSKKNQKLNLILQQNNKLINLNLLSKKSIIFSDKLNKNQIKKKISKLFFANKIVCNFDLRKVISKTSLFL